VVPDAAPHIIATVTVFGATRTLKTMVVGARSTAATVDVANREWTICIRFAPGALSRLTDVSARELADRSLAVSDVFSSHTLTNLELGDDAPEPVVVRALLELTRRACRTRAAGSFSLDSLSAVQRVAALAVSLQTPARSLRERAYREVGLSPKRILRVLRLHRALIAARRPGSSWSGVACAAGYADQAHLTREMQALVGETPSAWRARGSAVSFKTRGRRLE
jgi:AraC-like DNA-binding protein